MLIYHFVPMIFFYIPLTFLVEPVIIYKSSYVLLVAETSCCSIQLYVLNVCVFFIEIPFLLQSILFDYCYSSEYYISIS